MDSPLEGGGFASRKNTTCRLSCIQRDRGAEIAVGHRRDRARLVDPVDRRNPKIKHAVDGRAVNLIEDPGRNFRERR
jgi:hypothetical protein